MPLFKWKSEYSVHQESLDRHHQHLFMVLNTVYEDVMSSRDLNCVLPKIDQLAACTKAHFTSEEKYLQECSFSGLDEHIAKHREFTHNLEMLRARYHNNDLEVAKDLMVVLGEWLLKHVIKEDRKYAGLSSKMTN
jgi:hemerythrin